MQQPTTTSIGSPSLRQGLLFGLILGLVLAVINFITSFVDLGGAGLALIIVTFLLSLAVYFFAGMRASQQTGKLTTGLLAGLWAGLVSSLIFFLARIIITIANIDAIRARAQAVSAQQHLQIQYTDLLIIGSAVVAGLLVVGFYILVGLGMGSVGGAIGKRRANIPVRAYEEAMFQPPPPPANAQ
jgi:hypothetical protein